MFRENYLNFNSRSGRKALRPESSFNDAKNADFSVESAVNDQ
jgi:hypothetical protein